MTDLLPFRARLRQLGEPRSRSWLLAIALTGASFLAKVGAVSMPVVEGAVVPHPTVQPLPPAAFIPIVRAAKPTAPTVRITSRPSGVRVLDARGEVLGSTPVLVRAPNGAPAAQLVLAQRGYQDKRLLVTLDNQTVIAVLARSVARR